MIRIATVVGLLIAALGMGTEPAAAWSQDKPAPVPEDRISKLPAPAVVARAKQELDKKKGYHFTEKVIFLGAVPQETVLTGVARRDFCAIKGAKELYIRGTSRLTRDAAGDYIDPNDIAGEDGALARTTRHPGFIAADAGRFAATAKLLGEDKLGKIDCKVYEVRADPKTMWEQTREMCKLVPPPADAPTFEISSVIIRDKTTSIYKVWVGKTDIQIHKIDWSMIMPVDQSQANGYAFPKDVRCQFLFWYKRWDENLDIEIPKAVQQKFQVK